MHFFKLDLEDNRNYEGYDFSGFKRLIQDSAPKDLSCPYCQVIMDRRNNHSRSYFTIDHINPLSKSSDNSPQNLTPICSNCNSLKSNHLSFESFRLDQPQKLHCSEIDAIVDIMFKKWQIPYMKKLLKLVETEQYHLVDELIQSIPPKTRQVKLIKFIKSIDTLIKASDKEINALDFIVREKSRGIYFTRNQLIVSFTKHRIGQVIHDVRIATYKTKHLKYSFKTYKIQLDKKAA